MFSIKTVRINNTNVPNPFQCLAISFALCLKSTKHLKGSINDEKLDDKLLSNMLLSYIVKYQPGT